jgi:phosphoribosyl 1,2-cyclic phosphodiesterase
VKFHGTRGSTPVSGSDCKEFGGNTSCLEITLGEQQIILDTGSGFRNVPIGTNQPTLILYSHFHHDHIQGLMFNKGIFNPKNEIFICSAHSDAETTNTHLKHYFSGQYFPEPIYRQLSTMTFIDFNELGTIFDHKIGFEAIALSHPGGSFGYNIFADEKKITYLMDNEYSEPQCSELLDFSKTADLVVWDGMFTDAELPNHVGWGHSTIEEASRFANNADIKKLAVAHHAPVRTDEELLSFENKKLSSKVYFARDNTIL